MPDSDKPVIDMKRLLNTLTRDGWSGDEMRAIWHAVWDSSGKRLIASDKQFIKNTNMN